MKIKRKNLFVICCCIFISFSALALNDVKASDSKERIAGINRYETAMQISKAGWLHNSKAAVLATGQY